MNNTINCKASWVSRKLLHITICSQYNISAIHQICVYFLYLFIAFITLLHLCSCPNYNNIENCESVVKSFKTMVCVCKCIWRLSVIYIHWADDCLSLKRHITEELERSVWWLKHRAHSICHCPIELVERLWITLECIVQWGRGTFGWTKQLISCMFRSSICFEIEKL